MELPLVGATIRRSGGDNTKAMQSILTLCRTALLAVLLMGITVVNAQTAFDPVRFTVNQFVITGDNPLGNRAIQVLEPYLGEQAGLDGLSAAADELENALKQSGFSFHRVSLPPQELTSGQVEFRIVSFSIGQVLISGNEHFDEQNIRQSLPLLTAGTTPNTSELARSLKLANNHASKSVTLKFRESEQADAIDADLTVSDRNPQIFFLTLDNSGSEETEEFRSTLGYQHGNLFNRDHALTATLTVAPEDPDATTQIGVNYHIPLYQHGASLDFLLSDSEVNSGSVGEDIDISGKGSVFGVSYVRPLIAGSGYNHQWSAGFQYKNFENDVETGALTNSSEVLSFPVLLGYAFDYSMPGATFSGGLNYAMNLDAGSNNTDEDYAAVRTDAENDWSTINYAFAYDRLFSENWLFHAGLSGQSSSDLLISGEQFGVGGSSTLRGFEERSVTGDKGHQVSLEVWTPELVGMRFLAFYDIANLEFNDGDDDYSLSSAGLGLRWAWKQQLSISLDVGVIVEGLEEDDPLNAGLDDPINLDDDSRAHFSLVYRF